MRRQRMVKVAIVAASAAIVLPVVIILAVHATVLGPPGPPIATMDIRSGQPFELRFVSTGEVPRVFLDMDCESCSFPVTGSMTLTSGGKPLMSTEVSAGDSHDRAWGGYSRSLQQHLLFDAPEQPAGTAVTISGTLAVGPARGNWSTAPVKGAPPPRVKVLRLTVAP